MLIVLACVAAAPASAALFTFFPLPKAQDAPEEIATGPDGALWITQSVLGTPGLLGRITTAGTASTVAVPADSQPTALTTGPDGALWYSANSTTYAGSARIGRVGSEGVSEIGLPRANFAADGIATGPDGALWFTTYRQIGRLVPGGTMTFFPVAGPDRLQRIVAGPDGALWFTMRHTPTVGRITTAGVIRRFRLPMTYGRADDIAFASDGALWFTSPDSKLIGRRDPSGRSDTFRLTSRYGVSPLSIGAGSDAAMWFTTPFGIGRITPGGEITEIDVPNEPEEKHGIAIDITTGPDGAIWIALLNRGRGEVGRFDVATVGPRLLATQLADRRLRGRRGRLLRISFRATHRASGLLRLTLGRVAIGPRGERKPAAAQRPIRAKTGANTVALRLPRRPGTYRLELLVNKPGQTASDSTLVTVAP